MYLYIMILVLLYHTIRDTYPHLSCANRSPCINPVSSIRFQQMIVFITAAFILLTRFLSARFYKPSCTPPHLEEAETNDSRVLSAHCRD